MTAMRIVPRAAEERITQPRLFYCKSTALICYTYSMYMFKKGSAALVLIIILAVAVFISAGLYYYSSYESPALNMLQDQEPGDSNTNSTDGGVGQSDFTNAVYGLRFTVPDTYLILSNELGETDPTKAADFVFRKESANYQGVPMLAISRVNATTGEALQDVAQSIYDLNKESNASTALIQTSYGGVEAYEFGLKSYYQTAESRQILDLAGGKVVFMARNGRIIQLLMTGADAGLEAILQSVKIAA